MFTFVNNVYSRKRSGKDSTDALRAGIVTGHVIHLVARVRLTQAYGEHRRMYTASADVSEAEKEFRRVENGAVYVGLR